MDEQDKIRMTKRMDARTDSLALLVIVLLVFLPMVIAQGAGEAPVAGEVAAAHEEEQLTPDTFDTIEDPKPEDLQRCPTCGVTQFDRLDPAERAQYLQTDYNEDFADHFFTDPEHVGLNPSVERDYFSRTGNIGQNRESATKFLRITYNAPYSIDAQARDLRYDPATEAFTSGGKTITLTMFAGDTRIRGIVAVPEGFRFVTLLQGETEPRELDIIGAGTARLGFDAERGSFTTLGDDGGKTSEFVASPGSSSIEISAAGDVHVTGKVTGHVQREELIRFENREGNLIIRANGDIDADDAEVNTEFAYIDGRFSRRGNDVTSYSYDGRDTVVVDKRSGVGTRTQGQSRELGKQVITHLGQYAPDSAYTPASLNPESREATDPQPALSDADARERARQLRMQRPDVDGNGEVWIAGSAGGEVHVFARGRVAVEGYRVSGNTVQSVDPSKPGFVGHDGRAVLDYIAEGERDRFQIMGNAAYSDREIAMQTESDGSYVTRMMNLNQQEGEFYEVQCDGCEQGARAATIQKRMTLIRTSERRVRTITGARERIAVGEAVTPEDFEWQGGLTFEFTQTADGVTPTIPTANLNEIAAFTRSSGTSIAIDKDFFIRTGDGENWFGVATGGIGRYERTDAGFVSHGVGLDLTVRSTLGDVVIPTTDDELAAVNTFLAALGGGRYADLRGITGITDERVKAALERETGINIDQLQANEEYARLMANGLSGLAAGRRSGELHAQPQTIEDLQANARYFQRNEQAVAGQIDILRAQRLAAASEGKDVTSIDRNIRTLRRQLAQTQTARTQTRAAIAEEQYRQETRQLATEEGMQADPRLAEMQDLRMERDGTAQERDRLEREIQRLQHQYVEGEGSSWYESRNSYLVDNADWVFPQLASLEARRDELAARSATLEQRMDFVASDLQIEPVLQARALMEAGRLDDVRQVLPSVAQIDPQTSSYLGAMIAIESRDTRGIRYEPETNRVVFTRLADGGVEVPVEGGEITDPAMVASIQGRRREVERDMLTEEYNRGMESYYATVGKNNQFSEEHESFFHRVTTARFWDGTDIELEQRAEADARDRFYGNAIMLALFDHGGCNGDGGCTVQQIREMQPQEARGRIGAIRDRVVGGEGLHVAVGFPVSEEAAQAPDIQFNDRLMTARRSATVEMARLVETGQAVSDRYTRNLIAQQMLEEAEARINANHLDASMEEETYAAIARNFADTEAAKDAGMALAQIEDDHTLNIAGVWERNIHINYRTVGVFASEMIDPTIILPFAGVAAKGLIGAARWGVAGVRATEVFLDVSRAADAIIDLSRAREALQLATVAGRAEEIATATVRIAELEGAINRVGVGTRIGGEILSAGRTTAEAARTATGVVTQASDWAGNRLLNSRVLFESTNGAVMRSMRQEIRTAEVALVETERAYETARIAGASAATLTELGEDVAKTREAVSSARAFVAEYTTLLDAERIATSHRGVRGAIRRASDRAVTGTRIESANQEFYGALTAFERAKEARDATQLTEAANNLVRTSTRFEHAKDLLAPMENALERSLGKRVATARIREIETRLIELPLDARVELACASPCRVIVRNPAAIDALPPAQRERAMAVLRDTEAMLGEAQAADSASIRTAWEQLQAAKREAKAFEEAADASDVQRAEAVIDAAREGRIPGDPGRQGMAIGEQPRPTAATREPADITIDSMGDGSQPFDAETLDVRTGDVLHTKPANVRTDVRQVKSAEDMAAVVQQADYHGLETTTLGTIREEAATVDDMLGRLYRLAERDQLTGEQRLQAFTQSMVHSVSDGEQAYLARYKMPGGYMKQLNDAGRGDEGIMRLAQYARAELEAEGIESRIAMRGGELWLGVDKETDMARLDAVMMRAAEDAEVSVGIPGLQPSRAYTRVAPRAGQTIDDAVVEAENILIAGGKLNDARGLGFAEVRLDDVDAYIRQLAREGRDNEILATLDMFDQGDHGFFRTGNELAALQEEKAAIFMRAERGTMQAQDAARLEQIATREREIATTLERTVSSHPKWRTPSGEPMLDNKAFKSRLAETAQPGDVVFLTDMDNFASVNLHFNDVEIKTALAEGRPLDEIMARMGQKGDEVIQRQFDLLHRSLDDLAHEVGIAPEEAYAIGALGGEEAGIHIRGALIDRLAGARGVPREEAVETVARTLRDAVHDGMTDVRYRLWDRREGRFLEGEELLSPSISGGYVDVTPTMLANAEREGGVAAAIFHRTDAMETFAKYKPDKNFMAGMGQRLDREDIVAITQNIDDDIRRAQALGDRAKLQIIEENLHSDAWQSVFKSSGREDLLAELQGHVDDAMHPSGRMPSDAVNELFERGRRPVEPVRETIVPAEEAVPEGEIAGMHASPAEAEVVEEVTPEMILEESAEEMTAVAALETTSEPSRVAELVDTLPERPPRTSEGFKQAVRANLEQGLPSGITATIRTEPLTDDGMRVIVNLAEGDKPVGGIMFTYRPDKMGEDSIYLANVYIESAYRSGGELAAGRHIGSHAYEALEATWNEMGFRRVYLYATEDGRTFWPQRYDFRWIPEAELPPLFARESREVLTWETVQERFKAWADTAGWRGAPGEDAAAFIARVGNAPGEYPAEFLNSLLGVAAPYEKEVELMRVTEGMIVKEEAVGAIELEASEIEFLEGMDTEKLRALEQVDNEISAARQHLEAVRTDTPYTPPAFRGSRELVVEDGVMDVAAIGDVHGNFNEMRSALEKAGIIDSSGTWVGGNRRFVFLGDLVDKGPDTDKTLDFIMTLSKNAEAAGGRVIVIRGNHEDMLLDWIAGRKPIIGEDRWFDENARVTAQSMLRRTGLSQERIIAMNDEQLKAAFRYYLTEGEGRRYVKFLQDTPLAARVNNVFFVHGAPDFAAASLSKLGKDTRSRLMMTWGRGWEEETASIEAFKQAMGVDYIVYGHTGVGEHVGGVGINTQHRIFTNSEQGLIAMNVIPAAAPEGGAHAVLTMSRNGAKAVYGQASGEFVGQLEDIAHLSTPTNVPADDLFRIADRQQHLERELSDLVAQREAIISGAVHPQVPSEEELAKQSIETAPTSTLVTTVQQETAAERIAPVTVPQVRRVHEEWIEKLVIKQGDQELVLMREADYNTFIRSEREGMPFYRRWLTSEDAVAAQHPNTQPIERFIAEKIGQPLPEGYNPFEVAEQLAMGKSWPEAQETLERIARWEQTPIDELEQKLLELEKVEEAATRTMTPQDAALGMRSVEREQAEMRIALTRRIREIEQQRFRRGTSLETLIEAPPADRLMSKNSIVERSDRAAQILRDTAIEDDEIQALSTYYRDALTQQGVPDDPAIALEDIMAYRRELELKQGYLDFIGEIDSRFHETTQKVFLGTDGMEYGEYTYRLMTKNQRPNAIAHYISRKRLATPDEWRAIMRAVERGEGNVENLIKVDRGNIRLYTDVDNAIMSARDGAERGLGFNAVLRKEFDTIMLTDEISEERVIELVAALQRDVDMSQPMVLIDFAGRSHVQTFTLREGIYWIGENWDLLTPEQRALLGGDRAVFLKAEVNIQVGVVRHDLLENLIRAKLTPEQQQDRELVLKIMRRQPFAGLHIPGVYGFNDEGQDIVEVYRSIDVDDASLLGDEPLFVSTSAAEQAIAFQRRLIIADAINERRLAGAAP